MLYKIFKVIVSFTLKIIFRKIYLSGLENLDNSKPQILASNHPNGFLEPLLMACFFTRPLYFLVRGDVFDNRFLKPILIGTHQIPIFRFKDGFSKMRENTQTLQASSDVLLEGKCLLIFAEGSTKSIKMLRPLQKGLSRITFDTLARDPNIDLEILPVGINFTYNTLFNKEVMIKVGSPLKAKEYYEKLNETNQREVHQQLLDDTYAKMKPNIVHLEKQDRLSILENLFHIFRAKYVLPFYPSLVYSDQRLIEERNFATQIDNLDNDQYDELKAEIKNFKLRLKKHSFKLEDLNKRKLDIKSLSILISLLIPFVIGFVTNFIPMISANTLAKKLVKATEFKLSIRMVLNIVFFLLYYIILIIAFYLLGIAFYWLPVMAICGWLSVFYWDHYSKINWSKSELLYQFKNEGFLILKKYF